jgi:glycosyltransferase involved in cell wall biosynthesis
MLSTITPVILTLNEEPNIARTLAALAWASDIVLVDSHSTDNTVSIAASHPNVRVFKRGFDSHAQQWNYAIAQTGIGTEWILAMDADYVLTDELVEELRALSPSGVNGYCMRFEYCIFGKPLRGSVYPPVVTLFRRGHGEYRQDGHTQRLDLRGPRGHLRAAIRHDDRKPLSGWLSSQARYARLEAAKLASAPSSGLSAADRIRKMLVLAPGLVFVYALLVKGTILDGRAGLYYAFQRATAEMMLSLFLLDAYLGRPDDRA